MQGQIFGKSPENGWYIDGKSPENWQCFDGKTPKMLQDIIFFYNFAAVINS